MVAVIFHGSDTPCTQSHMNMPSAPFCTFKVGFLSVCYDTQNLNKTKSDTFFRSKFCPIPNSILFLYQLFLIPNLTLFQYQILRYRIQYSFWCQICSIPNLKWFKKWKSFETEKFQNRNVTLWFVCSQSFLYLNHVTKLLDWSD